MSFLYHGAKIAQSSMKRPLWHSRLLCRFASSDSGKLILPAVPTRDEAEKLRPPSSISNVSSVMFDPKVHSGSIPKSWDSYEPETPVGKELMEFILGVTGRPISTAHFMNAANLHPKFGYYVNAQVQRDYEDDEDDVFVEEENILVGDFVTAPEISGAFTECLAIWFYTVAAIDATKPYQYVECGPGTGRLMVDWLSCTMQLKKPLPTAIHLVEASPKLRQTQRSALESLTKERPELKLKFIEEEPTKRIIENTASLVGHTSHDAEGTVVQVHWHDTFTECVRNKVPNVAVFLIAQEFLDALPVYSFEADKTGKFRERMVDVAVDKELEEEFVEHDDAIRPTDAAKNIDTSKNDSTKEKVSGMLKPRFRVVLAPEITPPLKTLLPVDQDGNLISKETGEKIDVQPGTVVEVSPEAIIFCQDVASLLAEVGGAALIVDYGDKVTGDTVRAYWNHKQVPFLSRPGHVDVTADVNFGSLQHVVSMANTSVSAHGPVEQGQFLMSMGIQERIVDMMEREETTYEQADNMYKALIRLVSSEEMGQRYKVLSIVPGTDAPPGFEDLGQTMSVDNN